MSDHTKGKLLAERIPAIFNPKMNGFQLVGATPDGIDLMTVALCTVNEADEANALRLVACWNWCDGLSTEALEAHVSAGRTAEDFAINSVGRESALAVERDAIKAQRDALLEALKKCLRGLEDEFDPDWPCNSYHPNLVAAEGIARAAIEAAEKGGTP